MGSRFHGFGFRSALASIVLLPGLAVAMTAITTTTVSKAGTGAGTVTSVPSPYVNPPIACGNVCSTSYVSGNTLTLVATPDAGSVFRGWSGQCTGGLGPNGECIVRSLWPSAVGPFSVTATFDTTSCAADGDGDGIPDCIEGPLGRDPATRDNDIFADARLFAMQQYRDFLAREGEASGVAFWTAYLGGGGGRVQMVQAFFDSAEFQGLAAPIARLYFAYFMRLPDYGGLQYWVGRHRAGEPLAAISNIFAASAEFQNTYGSLDNGQFVARVYENVLGRAPDAGGQAYWTGQLATNALSRGELMAAFSESAEYRAAIDSPVYVTMIYAGMLRRAPDSGGFAYWVQVRDGQASNTDLIAAFLASAEYRARFLP